MVFRSDTTIAFLEMSDGQDSPNIRALPAFLDSSAFLSGIS